MNLKKSSIENFSSYALKNQSAVIGGDQSEEDQKEIDKALKELLEC